jgi:hypothetical protein
MSSHDALNRAMGLYPRDKTATTALQDSFDVLDWDDLTLSSRETGGSAGVMPSKRQHGLVDPSGGRLLEDLDRTARRGKRRQQVDSLTSASTNLPGVYQRC